MLDNESIEFVIDPLRRPISVGRFFKKHYVIGIDDVVQAEGKIETIRSNTPIRIKDLMSMAYKTSVKLSGFPEIFSMTYFFPIGWPKFPKNNSLVIDGLWETMINDETCWLLGANIPWYNDDGEKEILALRSPFLDMQRVTRYNAKGEAIELPSVVLCPTIIQHTSWLLKEKLIKLESVNKPGRK